LPNACLLSRGEVNVGDSPASAKAVETSLCMAVGRPSGHSSKVDAVELSHVTNRKLAAVQDVVFLSLRNTPDHKVSIF